MKENTGGKFDIIKIGNKENILEEIIRNPMISKAELGEKAGLTIPTVTRIVDEFIRDGLVESIGKGNSAGGRKPVLYRMNPEACYFFGTNITNKVKIILADINGSVLGEEEMPINSGQDVESILCSVKEGMEILLDRTGISEKKIAYSGIGTPGIDFKYINREQNEIFEPWYHIKKEEMEAMCHFPFPTVYENTARMGAAGELRFGYGKEVDNFIYIYVDEGIGMGVVVDGKIQMGYHQVGGEIGHTVVDMKGPICYCGNRGCLEMYCSSRALIMDYRAQLVNSGMQSDNFNEIDLDCLRKAVEQKEKTALEVLQKAGEILGIGVGNVVNMYNPQAVIFGGEISVRFPECIEIAKSEIRKHIFIHEAQKISLYTTQMSERTGNMGAIALAISSFTKEYCQR